MSKFFGKMALQVHFNKDFMGIYFSSLVFEPTSFQLISSYLGFTYLALASINYIHHIGCHCPLPGTLGGLKLLK